MYRDTIIKKRKINTPFPETHVCMYSIIRVVYHK